MHTIHEPDKLLEFINELKSNEKNKKFNGEVFTPLTLVNEMLDRLDEFYTMEHKKSIFSEDGLKWFDPAVGIGNFPIILYHRLMNGLHIQDEETRRKHILEKMIYSAELTPKNVFIYKKIFCGDKYKLNIYEGDTLTMNIEKEFTLSKFDVVLGNPPYQTQVGVRKTQSLWNLFVKKSLDVLKTNGYLVYIHPSGWRSPDGNFKDILHLILDRNLRYLCMNDFKKGKEVFKVGTNFDYYVLQNNAPSNTLITDMNGKTYNQNINGWKFIPSGRFDLYEKIIAKEGEERVTILYSSSLYESRKNYISTKKSEMFRYPCVYTIRRDGIKFLYSSIQKNEKNMFVPKVIWSNGSAPPIIDENGDYGLTQFSYAIIDDIPNLKHIEKAMNHPSFIDLMKYVKFQDHKYNYKVISLFKKDFWKMF